MVCVVVPAAGLGNATATAGSSYSRFPAVVPAPAVSMTVTGSLVAFWRARPGSLISRSSVSVNVVSPPSSTVSVAGFTVSRGSLWTSTRVMGCSCSLNTLSSPEANE